MVRASMKALRFGSLAKVLYVLTKIAMWVLLVLAGLSLLGTIVVGFVPAKEFGVYAEDSSVRAYLSMRLFEGQSFRLPIGAPLKPIILSIGISIIPISLICAAIALFLGRMLRSVVLGRPFEPDNGKVLCWIALCLPLLYIVEAVTGFVLVEYLRRSISFGIDNSLSFDLSRIVLPSLLLLILSGVFRYGSELQRDADETI